MLLSVHCKPDKWSKYVINALLVGQLLLFAQVGQQCLHGLMLLFLDKSSALSISSNHILIWQVKLDASNVFTDLA